MIVCDTPSYYHMGNNHVKGDGNPDDYNVLYERS